MQERIRIEDFQESNIEDLINVCSSKRLSDPIHQQGISIKKRWLRQILKQCGTCAKIAYYEGKPVAQILYYPEEANPSKVFKRHDVLALECIYNPMTEAQKLGIGTRLLKSVIQDAKQRRICLGNKPCKFIAAKAFNTGEFLPLPDFYKNNGFLSGTNENELYLSIDGDYEPTSLVGEYKPLTEDRNKAIIFYGPVCQFSFQFAKRIEAIVREVAPDIEIELINEWEKPEESIKRKNSMLIVNAKPIRTFFMETEKFKQEIRQAMN